VLGETRGHLVTREGAGEWEGDAIRTVAGAVAVRRGGALKEGGGSDGGSHHGRARRVLRPLLRRPQGQVRP
jgi:hypothetical protein